MNVFAPGLRSSTLAAVATLAALAVAAAQQPQPGAGQLHAAAASARLDLVPPAIRLDSAGEAQRLVLLATDSAGIAHDRTAAATFAVADPAIAAIEPRNGVPTVWPRQDGATELVARLGDAEVRVPLHVRGAGATAAVSFRNDVLPALTRGGCNAGSCHGAAAGKNGFALSLFGYDPSLDHDALTRQLRGRRLDFATPPQSLLLQKATAGVTHQGGKRIAVDDALYRTMLGWIEAGAPDDGDRAPALVGIDVLPAAAQLLGSGSRLPLVAMARYADGSDRDVTSLALWSSGDETSAAVDALGVVTSGRRGEAAILARFGGLAQVARVQVHDSLAPVAWPEHAEPVNFVDEIVFSRLRRARAVPAEPCSDETFFRRVHLDLLSMLPTPEQTRAFLADTRPDKRDRLVDELLERPEFAAAEAMTWAELLQVDDDTMEKKGAALFGRWLREAFEQRRPFDEVVREMLVAEGATFAVPPANFHRIGEQPELVAEKTAQVFCGVRLQCAQCHNHPFENWTMDDYYGFAAFFGQVGRKRGDDPYERVIWDRRNGEVRNKRDNQVAQPRLLGAGVPKIEPGTDRRAVLAAWLVAPDNPFFARNVANRAFARMFGRGLVEPVDDVRIGNPPSHPELLDALAKLFVESRFDVRPLYRALCRSRTWQSATAAADADPRLFAGMRARRLSAEALLDAIGAVTGVPTKYPGLSLGEPATAIDGGQAGVRFLDEFGRPPRQGACTCDRSAEPSLSQTLHLISGDTIAGKIAADGGRLARALQQETPAPAMLDELFLAAYSRLPRPAEAERVLAMVAAGDARAAWQDVYWAVLNSKEFLFQH